MTANKEGEFTLFKEMKYDIPAGIAVFFVAVPLCLGIAHASGAPLLSGLISGIIGGIVVGLISQSQLSVSGPAAGLTAIALSGIGTLGSFEAFLVATFIAGLLQILFGALRTGAIASYIPSTVISGMLSAIGLILILKQFPHMIGYDVEAMGVEEFILSNEDLNTNYELSDNPPEKNSFTVFIHSLSHINIAVMFIGVFSFSFLFIWDRFFSKKLKTIPGALVVVILAVIANSIINILDGFPKLLASHFVDVPSISTISEFKFASRFPNWSQLGNYHVYILALTIAVVASIETLLSLEAIDKLDPQKRFSPPNRELIAQGVGNALCGLFGGLPLTAVIVRGSVNVATGARTQLSAILHGILLLVAIMFLAKFLNYIPLACLAAILVYTGYKLIKPSKIIAMSKRGVTQFFPYTVTIVSIVLTDLLIGVLIGFVVAIISIFIENYKSVNLKVIQNGNRKRIVLGESVSFLQKLKIQNELIHSPANSVLEIDGSKSLFIDHEIIDLLETFEQTAKQKKMEYIVGGIKKMENHDSELQQQMKRQYDQLFINNRKWVDEMMEKDPDYFVNLSKGQSPQFLFIGCSDSRVPADKITGSQPGEMFVQRNIANMVVNTDINLMSVLQYSVEILNVKHVIVCGHYGCGGIRSAMEDNAHGLIDKWLRNIKDVYRLHQQEIDSIEDHEMKHKRMVELNVREQVYNLLKTSFVQKNRELYGFPQVHGWVYDIHDGKLVDLNIDMNNEFPEFNKLYKIY